MCLGFSGAVRFQASLDACLPTSDARCCKRSCSRLQCCFSCSPRHIDPHSLYHSVACLVAQHAGCAEAGLWPAGSVNSCGRETPVLVVLVLLLWAPVVIVLYRRRRPHGDPGTGWTAGRAEPDAWGGRERLVWTTVLLGAVLCWLRAEPHLAAAVSHPHVAPALERAEFHILAAGGGLRNRAFLPPASAHLFYRLKPATAAASLSPPSPPPRPPPPPPPPPPRPARRRRRHLRHPLLRLHPTLPPALAHVAAASAASAALAPPSPPPPPRRAHPPCPPPPPSSPPPSPSQPPSPPPPPPPSPPPLPPPPPPPSPPPPSPPPPRPRHLPHPASAPTIPDPSATPPSPSPPPRASPPPPRRRAPPPPPSRRHRRAPVGGGANCLGAFMACLDSLSAVYRHRLAARGGWRNPRGAARLQPAAPGRLTLPHT